jgi:hypothetical protein
MIGAASCRVVDIVSIVVEVGPGVAIAQPTTALSLVALGLAAMRGGLNNSPDAQVRCLGPQDEAPLPLRASKNQHNKRHPHAWKQDPERVSYLQDTGCDADILREAVKVSEDRRAVELEGPAAPPSVLWTETEGDQRYRHNTRRYLTPNRPVLFRFRHFCKDSSPFIDALLKVAARPSTSLSRERSPAAALTLRSVRNLVWWSGHRPE